MSTGLLSRLALVLIGVMLALCVFSCMVPRFQEAPRPSRRFIHHRQREHEHQRRHQRSALSWSKY